ncbi:hypothetical protein [Novosphingobium sp. SG720]|uniref:hypothetical protein n=1 Tax=Novosphingobium sp. SG720 TaxID=2586998 RepID=UPI0014483EB0|nr:hypothetical protein [Novosphingobium sp. SG720]NKJ45110.1 hypothetical protein [Novosphingobium sp. SG720]
MEHGTWASATMQSEFPGWPHGAHIPQYAERLRIAGFTTDLIRRSVWTIGHFWAWARDRDHTGGSIDEATITAFLAWRRENGRYRHGPRRALGRFLVLLRELGEAPPAPQPEDEPSRALIERYRCYLINRGYSAATIRHRAWFAAEAADALLFGRGLTPGNLTPGDIVHYVEAQAHRRGAGTAQTMCSSLRSFLGFLRQSGAISTDLAAAVPSVKSWKRTTLPTFLLRDQLEQVLAECDRTTSAGRRDYAILRSAASKVSGPANAAGGIAAMSGKQRYHRMEIS